jgi:tetratricopeptide (TPR) repeat protein
VTAAGGAVSGVAWAEGEDAAALEKVTKLNKKAVDEYQNLNFEESRKALRAALEICAQSGLENHPVTARTYIHLGIVTFTGFKQREDAVDQFRKALKIQPDIKLDKILATPEVQEVYRRGARRAEG